MAKEKILIVDDEPKVVELCSRILKAEGYETKGVNSGEEALKLLKQEEFALLLVDIKMPGMNGLATFQAAKEIDADIPGVIITGYGTIDTTIDALKSGLFGFVIKPFTPEELNVAVKEALERTRLEKENARLRVLLSLYEVSKAISSTLELEPLLNQILQTAISEVKADRGSLMLLDETTQELTIHVVVGLPEEVTKDVKQKVGEGIAGWVAKTAQPLLLQDGPTTNLQFAQVMRQHDIISALCLPLVSKNKVIGVLNLNRVAQKTPFTESDLELISILCSQAASAIENAQLHSSLQQSYFSTISALVAAVEAKDPYTRGHSERVAKHAVVIANELKLSPSEGEGIRVASILHDVGKIGVPENILLKPGKLTQEEYEVIKTHPLISAKILEPVSFPWEVKSIIKHHQERYDGSGYPDGLTGKAIPLGARILAVADTYEALTSQRAYRDAMSKMEAMQILSRVAGAQLDPHLVKVFLTLLEKET